MWALRQTGQTCPQPLSPPVPPPPCPIQDKVKLRSDSVLFLLWCSDDRGGPLGASGDGG